MYSMFVSLTHPHAHGKKLKLDLVVSLLLHPVFFFSFLPPAFSLLSSQLRAGHWDGEKKPLKSSSAVTIQSESGCFVFYSAFTFLFLKKGVYNVLPCDHIPAVGRERSEGRSEGEESVERDRQVGRESWERWKTKSVRVRVWARERERDESRKSHNYTPRLAIHVDYAYIFATWPNTAMSTHVQTNNFQKGFQF